MGLVGQLQFVDEHGLGDQYLTGYVRSIHDVTPEDVRRTAQRYLDPSRMSILVVGDKKAVQEQVAPYRAAVP